MGNAVHGVDHGGVKERFGHPLGQHALTHLPWVGHRIPPHPHQGDAGVLFLAVVPFVWRYSRVVWLHVDWLIDPVPTI